MIRMVAILERTTLRLAELGGRGSHSWHTMELGFTSKCCVSQVQAPPTSEAFGSGTELRDPTCLTQNGGGWQLALLW